MNRNTSNSKSTHNIDKKNQKIGKAKVPPTSLSKASSPSQPHFTKTVKSKLLTPGFSHKKLGHFKSPSDTKRSIENPRSPKNESQKLNSMVTKISSPPV